MVDFPKAFEQAERMEQLRSSDPRRVFVPQALGADEFLRVTWHDRNQILVFSHWRGDTCVAATPVRVAATPELVALLATAIAADSAGNGDDGTLPWLDPDPGWSDPDTAWLDADPAWLDAEPAWMDAESA